MKRQVNIIFLIVFIFILIGPFVYIFFTNDKEYAENENRYLSEKPRLTKDNLLSGQYFKNFESYVDDQFIFRENLYELKTKIQKTIGNKDINGVYLAKDNYLIEKTLDSDIDNKKLLNNIESLNEFAKNNNRRSIQLMVVPTSSLILKEKLPKYAEIFDQDNVLNTIKSSVNDITYIDLRNVLSQHKKEYIYYKTDHHWTTLGSFYSYQEWGKYNNIAVDSNSYFKKVVTSDFKGTLYSKLLDNSIESDEIVIFNDKNQIDYEITYNFNKSKSNNVYNFEKLREKDKYQIFLGGNYPELKITTNNKNQKNLLIIKDSYANAFVPFLLKHYENVHLVDMRYFKQNLDEYINDYNITEILILCNTLSFIK